MPHGFFPSDIMMYPRSALVPTVFVEILYLYGFADAIRETFVMVAANLIPGWISFKGCDTNNDGLVGTAFSPGSRQPFRISGYSQLDNFLIGFLKRCVFTFLGARQWVK